MKVLFACAEAVPYYQAGGLAHVARSLPDALRARNIDVRILLPHYPVVSVRGGALELEPELAVPWLSGEVRTVCSVHRPGPERAPAVLLQEPSFFATRTPYGAPGEHPVNRARRFAFLARAAVAYARRWGADVLHLNDWPTGLAPLYALLDDFPGATLYAIHDLPQQGNFEPAVLRELGIPDDFFRSENGVEFHGQVSFAKGGIALADRLVTVSPTYAREVQTPDLGAGLHGLLRFRRRVLHGILNGINPEQWDPATDQELVARYDASDLAPKEDNRAALLAELGLEDGGPLFVMITRLTQQKGVDLLLGALPNILGTPARVAILGEGGPEYHAVLDEWSRRAPGRFAARLGFDQPLARRAYAGADFLLMPSLYEPGGVTQLIAQRYGTPPVVRRTGGLADTVEDGRTGFTFDYAVRDSLRDAVFRAAASWRVPGWNPLRKRCMRVDHSWRRSARGYEQVYHLAIGRISA